LRSLATLPYVRMILVYLFAGFAYQGSLTFLPRFVGPEPFALALGLGAVGQVIAGILADRPRPDRILFRLSLAAAVLLAVLAFLAGTAGQTLAGSSPWVTRLGTPFTIAALAFGFFLFSLEALQNTLVTGVVPRAIRGSAFGLTFLSVFGLGSVGAAAAGWLMDRGDSSLLFVLLAASLAVSGGMALGVRKIATQG
jgi:MFS family permease